MNIVNGIITCLPSYNEISNPTIMVVLGTKEYWGQDPPYCIKKATPSLVKTMWGV